MADKEKLCIVIWQDNNPNTIISSLAGALPTANVKRYSKEDKSRTDVKCHQRIQYIYGKGRFSRDASFSLPNRNEIKAMVPSIV